ncbi:DUF4197 domain-containing protein [Alteraurantiacibacter aquimixticola]|uniref:DUF4197 domain-containing protein n=1 Tax=Alteraurantiacibacter aquimixticola TaxID=2489173 RepID=A0A4T3F625_9SPHN|nr:DUF4197 domain-containing protein [Alteraurantiacibacter aquimixticola]TIX51854.1 DUF4197 domain-containing protein [Alteraurantiacibacter aquimixticola]
MTVLDKRMGRRTLLGGMAGASVLALPGCTTMGGFSFVDAIRELLYLSSTRAFARLTSEGGYWDEGVGQLGLDGFLGNRGNILASILTSALFRDRLEDAFAGIAADASDRAAPMVADAVRVIGIDNALALVRGGPTAATEFLRGNMGNALVEAMVPEVGQAMRVAREPLVGQLLGQLTGVDVANVTNTFSNTVNNVIWQEIGVEEAAIRRDPRSTNNPLLIGVFAGSDLL